MIHMAEEELPVEIVKGKGGVVKVKAKSSKKTGNSAPKKKSFLAELASHQAKALATLGRKKEAVKK